MIEKVDVIVSVKEKIKITDYRVVIIWYSRFFEYSRKSTVYWIAIFRPKIWLDYKEKEKM